MCVCRVFRSDRRAGDHGGARADSDAPAPTIAACGPAAPPATKTPLAATVRTFKLEEALNL